jgi:SAM-dependent methyltransferase
MAKLTKKQTKLHEEACKILESDVLTFTEKEFVLENWRPDAEDNVGRIGAFFTPEGISIDLTMNIEVRTPRILDLCAGIGKLGFALIHYSGNPMGKFQITAIEQNPRYIEVGEKILTEATWIQMDVFKEENWDKNGFEDNHFDAVISNPPFGNIGHDSWRGLKVSADVACVAIALDKSKYGGSFILPSGSVPSPVPLCLCVLAVGSSALFLFITGKTT